MVRQLKLFTLRMIAGANVGTIILMLATGYSDRLHPDAHPLLTNVGLLFPFFLIINAAFLFFWILVKRRYVLIALAGFLVCYPPIRVYTPLNIHRKVPSDALKVLSYNVWLFAGWEVHGSEEGDILRYIRESDADIVCLQEATACEIGQERIDAALNPLYAYHDTACIAPNADVVALYSRYPIVGRERIPIVSKGNICEAFRLKVDDDTVVVINAHLETTGLSHEEKDGFRQLVKGGLDKESASLESRRLIDKLGNSSKRRAPQAEAIADYVHQHAGQPIILCGDFNDSPISYARHTIARELTDCYVESGNGPGISYHANKFFVRIDNIMCSNHWIPYECHVDRKITASDHYPIICWLKKHPQTLKIE